MKDKLSYGIIGYEEITQSMIFGQHSYKDKNGKWIKTTKTRSQFFKELKGK
ncbi:hypothetical protein LCGC14_1194950 [marine sediment metagenome]|uniref:Uncharacterized protein n=1 Tax=marine sediment metagenome TaxID=412755 RepID=A0A0F9LN50_9ZZZZ